MINVVRRAVVISKTLTPETKRAIERAGAVAVDDGAATVIIGVDDAIKRAAEIIAHSKDAPPPFKLEDRPDEDGGSIIEGLKRAVEKGVVDEESVEVAAFGCIDHPIMNALRSVGVWTALDAVHAAVKRVAAALDAEERDKLLQDWRLAMRTVALHAAPFGCSVEGGMFRLPVEWRFTGRIASPPPAQKASISAWGEAARVKEIVDDACFGSHFVVIGDPKPWLIERFKRFAQALQAMLFDASPNGDAATVACFTFDKANASLAVRAFAEAVVDGVDAPRIRIGAFRHIKARDGLISAAIDDSRAQSIARAWDKATGEGMFWSAPGAQSWTSHFVLNRAMLGDICNELAPEHRKTIAVAVLQAMYESEDVGYSLTTGYGEEVGGELFNVDVWYEPCVEAVERTIKKRAET